ncbi:hypothetical protein CVH10_09380 [Halomonas sp. ND22Bw]|uniref:hypothetical protein n=1 Tax=Halomonas sp. ND22Bw TaxID=2054178 RepID=UPI000D0B6C48|nr:hypothetical protein CVH10_09380 [Halomonas sp. ND22Bw]
MLPLTARKSFDAEFMDSLYQRLRADDESLTLVLRKKSGRKTEDPSEAHAGEIRNASNKPLFLMNPKESMVNLKHAGEHRAALLAFLKEREIVEKEEGYEFGAFCALAYAALIALVGFYYTKANGAEFLYPYLLACVAFALSGLALMAHAYRPGREKWSIPAMLLLFVGALPTAPSSLLVLPMVKSLGRNKLHRVLYQGREASQSLPPVA